MTPAVFGDELLYSKLAESLASGNGFTVRGEPVFFPAPLAVFLQVPAWLIDSTPTAYAVVKALNVAVMASAAFPAYCIARRLVRPSFALLAAVAAVAGPPMLYGPYLMSEALAYPVFLLALATMLRAIDSPSRRMEVAVIAISIAAVLTRLAVRRRPHRVPDRGSACRTTERREPALLRPPAPLVARRPRGVPGRPSPDRRRGLSGPTSARRCSTTTPDTC